MLFKVRLASYYLFLSVTPFDKFLNHILHLHGTVMHVCFV